MRQSRGRAGRAPANSSKSTVLWSIIFLLIPAFLFIPQFLLQPQVFPLTASDNFDRPDGPLGRDWTSITDGAMAISSGAVIGSAGQLTGELWTADAFTSDQYSQIEVTSTQLSGDQWIGLVVRAQDGGQDAYAGIYDWNRGSPKLELFKRVSGASVRIGAVFRCGALPAGTQLELAVVGSAISLLENGVVVISASDATLYGGAPGIIADGSAEATGWSGGDAATYSAGGTLPGLFPTSEVPGITTGGNAQSGSAADASVSPFQATYTSTSSSGIESYRVISSDNGVGPQTVRILRPTKPAPGVSHNFLYVLPVEEGLGTTYGDGLETLLALNAQNQYNLTIIEPTFGTDPWYADNSIDPNIQYETFMTQDLVPWVERNFAVSGNEQNWLIGFSKSGIGAQDLLLRHPDIFTLAASWDFPADMSAYDQFGPDSAIGYGTDANFQANYRLTPAFIAAHKEPFLRRNRIWIGGYSLYGTDVSNYGALLTSEGIAHSSETPQYEPHRWDSEWVSIALAALYQDSINWSAST